MNSTDKQDLALGKLQRLISECEEVGVQFENAFEMSRLSEFDQQDILIKYYEDQAEAFKKAIDSLGGS